MSDSTRNIPKTGLAGLAQNWQSDLIAAISVALVGLPLAMGIAIAAGLPPLSGVISSVIGGVVTTLYRGGHIAINGTGAGLIATLIASLISLDDGSGREINYLFAAVIVAGGVQVLLGLLRMGRLSSVFHSTVIHGILAAIGVIIFSKQIHQAMGTIPTSNDNFQTLKEVITMLPEANPLVMVISLIGLLLLIFQSKINYKLFHFIPAPLWVLALSIPLVYAFDFFTLHDITILGRAHSVGPDLLIKLPERITDAMMRPDFSRVDSLPFWTSVISITLIASIESLVSAQAVDKIDPYKRKTDLDKDLIGIGASTIISGFLGGLPVIALMVRSTVNINNHAKTKWSNMYHGLILLLLVIFFAPLIRMVPYAALAIILVYTGYKLAAPKVFKQVYDQGVEQLVIFVGTLVLTLMTNLLVGIFGGLLLALTLHFLLAKLPVVAFFKAIFKPGSTLVMHSDSSYELKLKGLANFLGSLKIADHLKEVPSQGKLVIDMSGARLVDFSVMEQLYDYKRDYESSGGIVELKGLNDHISSSRDKRAMKVRIDELRRYTPRQLSLIEMAEEHEWEAHLNADDQVGHFSAFYFFQSRTVIERYNRVLCAKGGVTWEICDVNFQEGALLIADQFHISTGHVRFPHAIPKFTIEKKNLLDRYLVLHKDIDYTLYDGLSDDLLVKVEDQAEMDAFLDTEMRALIDQSGLDHIESDGKGLLIFSEGMKLAQLREYAGMVKFLDGIRSIISKR